MSVLSIRLALLLASAGLGEAVTFVPDAAAATPADPVVVSATGGIAVATETTHRVDEEAEELGSSSEVAGANPRPLLRREQRPDAVSADEAVSQTATPTAGAPAGESGEDELSEEDFVRSLREELRVVCCSLYTAECQACLSMMSEEEYCARNPRTEGCKEVGGHRHEPAGNLDYRQDAAAFLEAHGRAAPCQLERRGPEEANRTWHALLAELLPGAAAGEQPAPPWTAGAPYPNEGAPLDRARRLFAQRMFGGRPGVIEGLASRWPARALWATEEGLGARLGGRRMTLTTFGYPDYLVPADTLSAESQPPPPETLSEYLARNESSRDFFVFVNEAETREPDLLEAVDALRADTRPHPAFAAGPAERHTILAIDGAGSSHGFHRHGAVWQTQVTGRKAWWLLPASVPAASYRGGVDEKWGRLPHVDGRPFAHPNACELLRRTPAPAGAQLCVVGPGETVLVPQLWWHATCGLDRLTAAVGGWLEDHRGPLRSYAA